MKLSQLEALVLVVVAMVLSGAAENGPSESQRFWAGATSDRVILCLNHVGPEDKPFLPIALSARQIERPVLVEMLGERRSNLARSYPVPLEVMGKALDSIRRIQSSDLLASGAGSRGNAFEILVWQQSLHRVSLGADEVRRFIDVLDSELEVAPNSRALTDLKEALATWRRRIPPARGQGNPDPEDR